MSVSKLIYASSANVYGLPKKLPVTEETPFNPRTPYDYSKVIAENLCWSYYKTKKLPLVILRSWKLFGEYDSPTTAIPRFIKACLDGEPISLFNGGRDVTDPVYVENYSWIVEQCLTRNDVVGEAFNIGAGSKMSFEEIAKRIRTLLRSSSDLRALPPRSQAESEPMISYPSIAKLREKLGFRPVVDFDGGIMRTAQWVKDQRKS